MAMTNDDHELSGPELISSMTGRMESLAAKEEWGTIEQIAARLRSIIGDVPQSERRDALLAAAQSIERMQTAALTARQNVTEKLGDIRRGRVATKAYGRSAANGSQAALR